MKFIFTMNRYLSTKVLRLEFFCKVIYLTTDLTALISNPAPPKRSGTPFISKKFREGLRKRKYCFSALITH